jgi:hypothetical protein
MNILAAMKREAVRPGLEGIGLSAALLQCL